MIPLSTFTHREDCFGLGMFTQLAHPEVRSRNHRYHAELARSRGGDLADSVLACYSRHPMDDMEPCIEGERPFEEMWKIVQGMVDEFIGSAINRETAFWQCAFALGLPECEGQSMTVVAARLGVTRACLSKGARKFSKINGLKPSPYMKSERAVEASRTARNLQLQ